jgi:uncharacterized protein
MNTNFALDKILDERLHVSLPQIKQFCDRWHIQELALFGSVLRDDFQPDTSDIDVLIVVHPSAKQGLSQWMDMKEDLENLFQRKVDLVSKTAIQQSHNWIRKQNILEAAQIVYAH